MKFFNKMACWLMGHDWPAWQNTESEIVLHEIDGNKKHYKIPAQARECSRCGHPEVNWDYVWLEFHRALRREDEQDK